MNYLINKVLIGVAAVGALALGSAAQAQDMQEINVITANDSTCSLYEEWTANVFGFWPSMGLKVNMLPSETTVPFVAFLQNGDADLVMLDSAQVLQAADAGLPINVLYETHQFAPEGIVVTADSPIKSLKDLKGATIGLASDRDLITTIITLDSIGETLDSFNITSVVVGDSGPVMAGALKNKTIDAFAGGSSDRAGIEAAGVQIRNITPAAVSRNPGNSFVAWGPTVEEKRPVIEKFLKGWAMANEAAVLDDKLTAAACRTQIPEQFEDIAIGMRMIDNSVFVTHLRRTKNYGELQPDVWAAIQPPYVKAGEIKKEIDPATFLNSSFTAAANDWETVDVKDVISAWQDANKDKLID